MKQNDAKMMKIDIVNFGEKIQKAKENLVQYTLNFAFSFSIIYSLGSPVVLILLELTLPK
jgi:hypothetical protein